VERFDPERVADAYFELLLPGRRAGLTQNVAA
jgi:hypothetical protein